MHLNNEGRIIAYSKARGKKAAIKTTVETVMEHIQKGRNYNDKFIIGHSNCLDLALETRDALKEYFPNAEEMIKIDNIGTIISAHCGPGTIAIFYYGDERLDK